MTARPNDRPRTTPKPNEPFRSRRAAARTPPATSEDQRPSAQTIQKAEDRGEQHRLGGNRSDRWSSGLLGSAGEERKSRSLALWQQKLHPRIRDVVLALTEPRFAWVHSREENFVSGSGRPGTGRQGNTREEKGDRRINSVGEMPSPRYNLWTKIFVNRTARKGGVGS